MKRKLLYVALLAAPLALLALQQSGYWVPLWNGSRWEFPRLGPTFTVSGGEVNAVAPPVVQRTRHYDVKITPDAQGKYMLPGTHGLVVHINGLRATPFVDYQIQGNELVPLWQWDAETLITIDYDDP